MFPKLKGLALIVTIGVTSLSLNAQTEAGDPADDPQLRLPGKTITTVPGGMPSVGMRALAIEEQDIPFTHAVSFDPILLFRSINIAYDRRILGALVVGGRVILPIGIRNLDGKASNPFGVGLEARLFPYGTAPTGLFLRLAPTYYTGSYEVDIGRDEPELHDLDISSFVADIGWRWMMAKRMSFDFMVGIEDFSNDVDSLAADVPFVAFRMKGSQTVQIHGAARFGYSW